MWSHNTFIISAKCYIDSSSCNANLAVLNIDSCEYHSPNDQLLNIDNVIMIRKQLYPINIPSS